MNDPYESIWGDREPQPGDYVVGTDGNIANAIYIPYPTTVGDAITND